MKALRYLLIVMGLMSVLSVSAQTLAQQPEVKMQSTSIMAPSGSALPQAAVTGAVTTYSTGSAKTSGPRRVQEDDSPGTEPGQEEDTPICDAAWPLMLLALAYVSIRFVRTRKRVREADNV